MKLSELRNMRDGEVRVLRLGGKKLKNEGVDLSELRNMRDGEVKVFRLGGENLKNEEVDLESLKYTEEEIREMTISILENLNKESKKILKNPKVKPKGMSFNQLFASIIVNKKDFSKNIYYKSFTNFINKNEIYTVEEFPDCLPENNLFLENLFKENLFRLIFGFHKEKRLFYDGKINIDEKTSFGEDLLHIIALIKYILSYGDLKLQNEIKNFIKVIIKPNHGNEITDLGDFLEYIIKDHNNEDGDISLNIEES